MPTYTHRCEKHGDFSVERSMTDTRPFELCLDDSCMAPAPKVLGAALQFTYGRAVFHSGPDGTGETVRETAQRWVSNARARGLDPEPQGVRWV
jgi:hypothetical protein